MSNLNPTEKLKCPNCLVGNIEVKAELGLDGREFYWVRCVNCGANRAGDTIEEAVDQLGSAKSPRYCPNCNGGELRVDMESNIDGSRTYVIRCRGCGSYRMGRSVQEVMDKFWNARARRLGAQPPPGLDRSFVTVKGDLESKTLQELVEATVTNTGSSPVVLPEGVQLYVGEVQRYAELSNDRMYRQANEQLLRGPMEYFSSQPYAVKFQVQKNRPAPEGELFKFFQQAYGDALTNQGIPESMLRADPPTVQSICPCCQKQPLKYLLESGSVSWYRVWCTRCLREGLSNTSLNAAIENLQDDEKQRRLQLDLEASLGMSMQQHIDKLDLYGGGVMIPLALLRPEAKPKKAKLRAEDLIPAIPLTLDPEVVTESTAVLLEAVFVLDPEVEPEDEEDDRE